MRESVIEEYLKIQVEKAGGLCWKFVSPGLVGVPDRIVLMPGGKSYFVECKKPGGKLSAPQERRKWQIRTLGYKAYVVYSLTDVDHFVEDIA